MSEEQAAYQAGQEQEEPLDTVLTVRIGYGDSGKWMGSVTDSTGLQLCSATAEHFGHVWAMLEAVVKSPDTREGVRLMGEEKAEQPKSWTPESLGRALWEQAQQPPGNGSNCLECQFRDNCYYTCDLFVAMANGLNLQASERKEPS